MQINSGQNVSGASAKSSVGLGALDAADLKKAGFDPNVSAKVGLDKPMQTASASETITGFFDRQRGRK